MYYARWCKDSEMKEILREIKIGSKIDRAGIPITYGNNKVYINDKDGGSLIIGATGSGKTQVSILPLAKLAMMAHESIVINDPKGEIYGKMAGILEANNYNIIVLDFDNPNWGNSWNPFILPYSFYKNGNSDKAVSLIENLGYYLFFETSDKQIDSFWINSTIDYFTGLTLYLFENASVEEINLNSIFALSNAINEEKNLISFLSKLDKNSAIYYNVSGTLNAPIETRGSVLSTFNQKIKKYISRENLCNLLSNNNFNIENISNEKSALFIISGNNNYSNSLIPLLTSQLVEATDEFGNHNKKLNIILDEFDSLVPIRDFGRVINYSRSCGVKFTLVIRSYVNLTQIYGKENAEMIKASVGNILYLWSNDIYTLEEISRLCGIQNKDNIPLISVEQLKTMKTFEVLVLIPRMMPYMTKLIPDYKINWGFDEIVKEIPTREKNETKIYNF